MKNLLTKNERGVIEQNQEGIIHDMRVTSATKEDLKKSEIVKDFNETVQQLQKEMDDRYQEAAKQFDTMDFSLSKIEIKPMWSRIIVKKLKVNPFVQVKSDSGLITSAEGYQQPQGFNSITGKYEEMKEFIVVGIVMEVGPDVKYLKEGDAVYYRIDTSVPVPFFHQGFYSIDEKQVIAFANEGLNERLNTIAHGTN